MIKWYEIINICIYTHTHTRSVQLTKKLCKFGRLLSTISYCLSPSTLFVNMYPYSTWIMLDHWPVQRINRPAPDAETSHYMTPMLFTRRQKHSSNRSWGWCHVIHGDMDFQTFHASRAHPYLARAYPSIHPSDSGLEVARFGKTLYLAGCVLCLSGAIFSNMYGLLMPETNLTNER